MTQFALAKMPVNFSENLWGHLAPCPSEGLISDASNRIFETTANVYLLMPYGRPFDEIYLEEQRKAVDDADPNNTHLLKVLKDVSIEAEGIALWYGADFLDLPIVSSWPKFQSALQQDLKSPSFETYLIWHKSPGELRDCHDPKGNGNRGQAGNIK